MKLPIPFFSVVVPVYNVEKYLDNCVKSILRQNFSSYEIILVDDGSTDSSPIICDAFQEQHSMIHVVHQHNRGLPGARETGVRYASGEYIMFVDSDDWLVDDALSTVYQAYMSSKSDVIAFDYVKVNRFVLNDNIKCHDVFPDNCIVSNSKALDLYFNLFFPSNVWQFAVRRSIYVNEVRFPVGIMNGEDMGTTYQFLGKSKTVCFYKKALYCYAQGEQSYTKHTRDNEEKALSALNDLWTIQNMINEYVNVYFPDLKGSFKRFSAAYAFSSLLTINLTQGICCNVKKQWRKKLRSVVLNQKVFSSFSDMYRCILVFTGLINIKFVAKFCEYISSRRH